MDNISSGDDDDGEEEEEEIKTRHVEQHDEQNYEIVEYGRSIWSNNSTQSDRKCLETIAKLVRHLAVMLLAGLFPPPFAADRIQQSAFGQSGRHCHARSRRHRSTGQSCGGRSLATIFTCKRFHLIATTDHRRASALFDRSTVNACNLLWIRATTFENYTREILAGESKIFGFKKKKSKTNHTISSLESVWASLTSKSCDSLLLLVKMVLANKNGAGVQFWDWYRLCRREFFVSSEQALRQHVVEFRDHRIITLKTNAEGDEMTKKLISTYLKMTISTDATRHFSTTPPHSNGANKK
ncbi:Origin recognition complex subunit [Trichinella spiralis]|uniref:Origin recognition complex subunit n=1 Tax=Trichinella spiralis TaxID=6334 RepID=A0ABR3KN97_TRISP